MTGIAGLVFGLAVSGWAHGPGEHGRVEKKDTAREAAFLEVEGTLSRYRAAFEARSTEKLAEVVDKDLLVLEGTAKNVGWADYRDSHIGPEMKEWESLSYADPVAVDWQIEGDLGWAAVQSTVTIVSGGKPMTIDAAETFVLRRSAGRWLIRHIHWSGKRRPESKPPEAK